MKKSDKSKDLSFEIKFYENIIKESPNFTHALIALGDAYTRNCQYQEGLKIDKRLSKLRPDDPVVFYNLACSYSVVGDIDASFEALNEALRLGYRDFGYMDKDADLKNLREDSRYQALKSRVAGNKKL